MPDANQQVDAIYKNILSDLIYGSKINDACDNMLAKKLIHQIIIDKVIEHLNLNPLILKSA